MKDLRGVYRHNKTGKMYRVIGVALHTETNEYLVVYEPLYQSDYPLFVRPYTMFTENVVTDGVSVPRFEYIKDDIK